jgi:hypothetical protein
MDSTGRQSKEPLSTRYWTINGPREDLTTLLCIDVPHPHRAAFQRCPPVYRFFFGFSGLSSVLFAYHALVREPEQFSR